MASSAPVRRFEVLDVVGRGGFGTVYRARQLESVGDSRLVALKILNDAAARHTSALSRLRDEARVLGQLRHRAFIQVDAVLRIGGYWCLVMEFVEGVSVRQILDNVGRLPVSAALEIVQEVASGLATAWAAPNHSGNPLHLLHRDVKPSNIQLTATGAVKLLDFGVARADLDAREARSGSMVFGSIPYMAPERMRGEDSHQADVYSLGVTLLEMVSQRLSRQGEGTSAEAHASRLGAGLTHLAEYVDVPGIEGLLRECLAYEADARLDAGSVEERCRVLRESVDGPSLRDWAVGAVPQCPVFVDPEPGDLVGEVLVEQHNADEMGTLSDLLSAPSTFDGPDAVDLFPLADAEPGALVLGEAGPGPTRWVVWALVLSGAGGLVLVALAVVVSVFVGLALWFI